MRHEPALDGLRALAVAGVVFAHTGTPLIGGGRGVDVFFVLSGFLVTRILMNDISIGDFLIRRVRRLMPALLVFLTAYLLTAPLMFPGEVRFREAGLALSYVYNWSLVFDLRETAMAHMWSLSIEEQFYLAWPFLLPALLRSKQPVVWLAVAWFALTMARVLLVSQTVGYYATPFHATGLIVGAIIALHRTTNRLGSPGLILVLLTFVVDPAANEYWSIAAAELGAAMLIPALCRRSVLQQAFARAAWLGLISYGIYLWHWPIALSLRGQSYAAPAALFGGIGMATLSYYWVERRFRGPPRNLHTPIQTDHQSRREVAG